MASMSRARGFVSIGPFSKTIRFAVGERLTSDLRVGPRWIVWNGAIPLKCDDLDSV